MRRSRPGYVTRPTAAPSRVGGGAVVRSRLRSSGTEAAVARLTGSCASIDESGGSRLMGTHEQRVGRRSATPLGTGDRAAPRSRITLVALKGEGTDTDRGCGRWWGSQPAAGGLPPNHNQRTVSGKPARGCASRWHVGCVLPCRARRILRDSPMIPRNRGRHGADVSRETALWEQTPCCACSRREPAGPFDPRNWDTPLAEELALLAWAWLAPE